MYACNLSWVDDEHRVHPDQVNIVRCRPWWILHSRVVFIVMMATAIHVVSYP